MNTTPKLHHAEYIADYRVRLSFSDGTEGEVDLEAVLWGEVFQPLKDKKLFQNFKLDADLATITWPNGADLAPEYLYQLLQQKH